MEDTIFEILKGASEVVNSVRQSNKVTQKTKFYDLQSLVSEADLESEKYILSNISKHFPNDSIFSEEAGESMNKSDRKWYVDPLDGTSNFVRNIPLWGITMGLLEKGEPTIGAMYFPDLKQFFYAEKGHGAYQNDKRIHVSTRKLGESLFFARSYWRKQLYLDTKLGQEVGLVKIVDSSAYELAQIAAGNGEIYAMANVPHDVVAGICLVREAGGIVTAFEGKEWTIDTKGIVVTNGIVHEDVLKLRNSSLYQ